MNQTHILIGKNDTEHLKKLMIFGVVIGILVGLIISIYRKLVVFFQSKMIEFYDFGRTSIIGFIILMIIILFLSYIVGMLTQKESKIGGSGIPQVTGQIKDMIKINRMRILSFKFIGGLIGLAAGLTVGREGPSVQIGAAVGEGVGYLSNQDNDDKKLFITAGAAAGLSAAFNAPISGVAFVLEELHNKFDKYTFIIAAFAAYLSDFISSFFFGTRPVINVERFVDIPPGKYYLVILLAIIVGILAPIFIKGIYYTKRLYEKLPIPAFAKVMIPFILTSVAIILIPDLFGSGEHFIFLPIEGNANIYRQIFLLLMKFLLLLIAFSSGMPGGIFLPMLVLGSLIGNIFGSIAVLMGFMGEEYILAFSLIAMAANFSAIVRSPITAMLLIIEMTGAFTYFLPLALTVAISYFVIEILRIKPVYEVLLEIMLEKDHKLKISKDII